MFPFLKSERDPWPTCQYSGIFKGEARDKVFNLRYIPKPWNMDSGFFLLVFHVVLVL